MTAAKMLKVTLNRSGCIAVSVSTYKALVKIEKGIVEEPKDQTYRVVSLGLYR